jgi:hypothetical protein
MKGEQDEDQLIHREEDGPPARRRIVIKKYLVGGKAGSRLGRASTVTQTLQLSLPIHCQGGGDQASMGYLDRKLRET